MTRPRPLRAAAALLLSAALAGCSGSGTPSNSTSGSVADAALTSAAAPGSAAAVQVTIKDFAFAPAALTVSPGQSVTVVNQDSAAHTLTADDKSFDTGPIQPGASATFTAPQSGAHPYICTIHPFMHGTLTVG
ncbi:cupredoxin family copper-binding protein [Kitasatospora sp. NPDC094011]|uniref:cupredoxin domain-containing protein n=1 Tax=Kitasatospora sp. NPDC094011 TaxID=3364090 RepID=UPI0038285F3B